MPTDPADLERRLALSKPEDRVRGMMFNELLALVGRKLGPEVAVKASAVLPPGERYRDLLSYPISDFLKLMYCAADLLEPQYGSAEAAIRACGAATVEAFSRTTAGELFFKVLALAGPSQLLKNAGTGYRSVVTYGTREFTPTGDASGELRMKDDMQPPAYHEGVLLSVLGAVGFDATVTTRSNGALNDTTYVVSWTKR